jgi:hydroxypyruvate reductase
MTDDPVVAQWSHEIASEPGWTADRPAAGRGNRTRLVAVGKAALAMTRGALHVLGDAIDEGLVLMPRSPGAERPAWLPVQLRLRTGAHPLPDVGTVEAAREVAELVSRSREGDRLLVLLSGGGSSLLTLPAPGLSVDDVRETSAQLMAAGWSIEELNAVRPALEVLKAGGLARIAGPARILGLLLSDVVGDDPAVIASGPLSPTPTGVREAETLLRRRGRWDALPPAVQAHLLSRRGEESPPAPRVDPVLRVVGNGERALDAAAAGARRLGYRTHVLTHALQGEARRAGRGLARVGRAVRDGLATPMPPACLLAAGETTVTVTGPGRGGRNQEVALGAASLLEGHPGIVVASLGTDGVDGPTDAAGALVDEGTVGRARSRGMEVSDALHRNDAYPLLEATGDLIRTGPTGTNVADLMLVLVGEG